MSKNKTRTKDKYRVVYNDTQRIELENEFRLNEYIAIPRKQEIAQKLQLSERQIKIWFQNRRAKKRKQQKKQQQHHHQPQQQDVQHQTHQQAQQQQPYQQQQVLLSNHGTPNLLYSSPGLSEPLTPVPSGEPPIDNLHFYAANSVAPSNPTTTQVDHIGQQESIGTSPGSQAGPTTGQLESEVTPLHHHHPAAYGPTSTIHSHFGPQQQYLQHQHQHHHHMSQSHHQPTHSYQHSHLHPQQSPLQQQHASSHQQQHASSHQHHHVMSVAYETPAYDTQTLAGHHTHHHQQHLQHQQHQHQPLAEVKPYQTVHNPHLQQPHQNSHQHQQQQTVQQIQLNQYQQQAAYG